MCLFASGVWVQIVCETAHGVFVGRETCDLGHTWSLLWNSVTVFCPSRLPPLRQTSVCVHRAVGPGGGSDPPGGLAARPLLLSAAPGQAAPFPPARPRGQGHPQGHQHRWARHRRAAERPQRDAAWKKQSDALCIKKVVRWCCRCDGSFSTRESTECISPNKTCPIRLGGWQDTWQWLSVPGWPSWSRAAPSLLQLWLRWSVGGLSSLQNCASVVFLTVFNVESQQPGCRLTFRTFNPSVFKMMQIFQPHTKTRNTFFVAVPTFIYISSWQFSLVSSAGSAVYDLVVIMFSPVSSHPNAAVPSVSYFLRALGKLSLIKSN